MKVKHKKAHFSSTSGLHSASRRLSLHQLPFPPFFFFGGAFLRVAPDAAGFCCRGGTTLLPAAVEDPDPGLGEVGGLLAVLLASLERTERVNRQRRSCSGAAGHSQVRGRSSCRSLRAFSYLLLLLALLLASVVGALPHGKPPLGVRGRFGVVVFGQFS